MAKSKKEDTIHKNKVKAIVVDNVVTCGECGHEKFASSSDYKQVKFNGENWTEFTVRCLDCDSLNYYLSQITLDEGNKRISVEESSVEEVSEDDC